MAKIDTSTAAPFMGEFVPLATLWEGGAPFPSEVSARWFMREHKAVLAQEGAIAVHRGRIHVIPDKVAAVARRLAVETARKRYCA